MNPAFNIYCDESCHLEHDGQPIMVLGAVWCPREKTREIAVRLRALKVRHGLSPSFEIKWSKVSPAQAAFYLAVLDDFFDDDDLHFRALIVGDKSKLRHEDFDQDHDTWYYKMYFDMLKVLFDVGSRYTIYLDIKDTRGWGKTRHLAEVLRNNAYDFDRRIIESIQTVRSHEVEQLQLADLLIGAVSYANRQLTGNAGKVALVERMRQRSGYDLQRTTLFRENKVNLFRWEPAELAV
jgi:hypothetical protein